LDEIKTIKNEIIENFKNKIKLIEEAYSEFEKNINLQVSLINNLIDTYSYEKNYNNYNYEIIQNIKNIEKIKFSSPDFSSCKNIFEKSEMFISFYKNFKIYKSKIINTLSNHSDAVNQIILLKDGRIASSSNDKSILIYNKENYSIELKIDNFDSIVFNIIQASNDYIIASLTSGFIIILKLNSTSYEIKQKIQAHNNYIRKTIEMKDGKLISCSDDKTIKIWKLSNNQYILENTLNQYTTTPFSSILYLNDNIIVSTPYGTGSVIFWNIKELKIISQIEGINCTWCWNILKKLSNELFILGGVKYIYLFSILNYNLVNKIEIDSDCYSICCLSDINILTGHQNGKIKQYNLINNEFKLTGEKKYHDNIIRVIFELNNNLILSGSDDKKINIYKNE